MWCVLKEGPIFAGFKPGVTDADVVRAVEDGSFENLLVRFDAKVGECYFIPGGLVHAIGEGTSVFEVQQSSNTTFRLYDWGRLDANGNPRQLHVKEALAAMDLSLPPPVPGDSVECRYFTFRRVDAGKMSADSRRRVIYDPSMDSLMVVEPLETPELSNPAFEVMLP
jgi:mannose-6-phosphate isomerase